MADHEMTSRVVRDACFNASVPNYETDSRRSAPPTTKIPHLYYMDPVQGSDGFGDPLPMGGLIDVISVWEKKRAMLACHESQRNWLLRQHGIDEYLEMQARWSRRRGWEINVEYAEAFRQHRGHPYPHDDLLRSRPCGAADAGIRPVRRRARESMSGRSGRDDRLASIGRACGFDMFWIIGGDLDRAARLRTTAETPHSDTVFGRFAKYVGDLEPQFHHVEWHGFRFYDLIYPLFLFLVGVVLPFSLGKYGEGPSPGSVRPGVAPYVGADRARTHLQRFPAVRFLRQRLESKVRLPGVLQRIGICYFFAALIVMNFRPPMQMVFFVAILGLYYVLLTFMPPGDGKAGDLTRGNLAGWLDRKILGGTRLYYGFGDNEGVCRLSRRRDHVARRPGRCVLKANSSPLLKVAYFFGGRAACVQLGWLWETFGGFPVNKILWTSSFVLVAGGWSLILLSAFYFVIDVCGIKSGRTSSSSSAPTRSPSTCSKTSSPGSIPRSTSSAESQNSSATETK